MKSLSDSRWIKRAVLYFSTLRMMVLCDIEIWLDKIRSNS